MVVLEELEHARARGAEIYGEVVAMAQRMLIELLTHIPKDVVHRVVFEWL